MKRFKRLFGLVLAVCCIFVFSIAPAFAASNKTVTRSYDVSYADNGFKILNCYARDSFKITYNGKKVISCTASQSKKDLYSDVYTKGGIKCKKKTAGKWIYESVWCINLKLMPKPMQVLAAKYTPLIAAIQKIGTIVRITTTYEVNGNGTLKKTNTDLKWFTGVSKYKKQIEKVFKF